MPVSGHTRYLAGRPCLGCGRVTIRAWEEAFEGRTKTLEVFSARGGILNFESAVLGSEAFDSDGAGLVDLVLAMMALLCVVKELKKSYNIRKHGDIVEQTNPTERSDKEGLKEMLMLSKEDRLVIMVIVINIESGLPRRRDRPMLN
jgi:hypothetical protein